MAKQRRLETMLDLADQDVEAALLLTAKGNRYAAFHCQQAAEKLIKALLDHRGIEFGGEHHLDVLVDKLPDAEPWKAILRDYEKYSAYATTFRYAKPGGGLMPAPDPAIVEKDAREIGRLIAKARAEVRSATQ
jgi:HEPN domain-containing protein